MKMAEELQRELCSINRKSYPAYKGLKGAYQFPDYQLFIEHVQGDPFAAPSALRIFVPHSKAKFPERYYWDKCSKVALQDALLRRFAEISAKFCYQAKGSGKSGVIQVSHCGQEVLERTACEITKEGIHIRFFVGFPANGRTINSGELEKILFVYLPKCVEMSLYHRKVLERETEQVICLKEDQRVIREELKKRGLIAFVANGSILPRQSGNSDLPMKDAVPFQSPKSMEITIQLRHRGSITGMGIRKGITLIAGGGYHGKSTLLEALEKGVYDHIAGPEISVATTKAYSAQLAAMYCLAVQFAKVRGKISEEQYSYYISEMLTIPDKMQKVLEDKERIQWFASKYANAHDVFFVGRGIDYAVCLEGSLKLKEISYIHSEAYAAGELKHGTISLIEQGTLVIGVLTQGELYEKTISNMLECKSRGAYLMGLTTYGKYEIEDQVNFTVYVPKVDEHFVGSLAVVPLQLIGYYVSVAKGLDVDKPRNLAKSVTVE